MLRAVQARLCTKWFQLVVRIPRPFAYRATARATREQQQFQYSDKRLQLLRACVRLRLDEILRACVTRTPEVRSGQRHARVLTRAPCLSASPLHHREYHRAYKMPDRFDVSQRRPRRSLLTLPREIIHLILNSLSCREFNNVVRTCREAYKFNGRLYNDNRILFYAAKWNEKDLAQIALKFTADVNEREPEQRLTALATALFSSSDDVATLILQQPGIDVSCKANGIQIWYYAAARPKEVWSMILERTNDINLNNGSRDSPPLTEAINHRNTELALLLLERPVDIFIRDCFWNMTAFEHAARMGNVEILKLLLQSDARAQIANSPGVIAIAADFGSVEVVELLYNNGADVNEEYPCWTAEDIQYDNDLDDSDQASTSTDESELNVKTRWPNRGRTALVIAANGRADLVEWLLNCDEIQLNSTILQGALSMAVLGYKDECLLRLLRSPKVNVTDEQLKDLHRIAPKVYVTDRLGRTAPKTDHFRGWAILESCIGKPAAEYRQALKVYS